MSSPSEPNYRVSRLPHVLQQIKDLVNAATSDDERQQRINVLASVYKRLEDDPSDFGDPEYRTKKTGGKIYHAILRPFIVKYALYELEKAVVILQVKLVL